MNKNFDFVGHRKLFVCIALAVLAFGLLMNLVFGTQMDVAFKGGTLLQYSYTGDLDTDAAARTASDVLGKTVSAQKSTAGDMTLVGLSLASELTVDEQKEVEDTLAASYADNELTLVSSTSLGASMGQKFFIKCLVALALAALFLLVYVGLRFRKIGGLSAGAFALLALLHDLLIVYFAFVVFRIPLNDNFVAVILTILGYSLNDTIVIYDRIRENRKKMGKDHTIAEIVNTSLNPLSWWPPSWWSRWSWVSIPSSALRCPCSSAWCRDSSARCV